MRSVYVLCTDAFRIVGVDYESKTSDAESLISLVSKILPDDVW